jgi:hypothetical protein
MYQLSHILTQVRKIEKLLNMNEHLLLLYLKPF